MTGSNSSFWGESFIGRRGNNEDNFCIKQINEKLLVLAVADGMGGTVAGEKLAKLPLLP
jgi:serine/threonine protein phosphatase PrpC